MGLTFRAVAADTGAIGGDPLARVPGDRRHRRGRDRLLRRSPTTPPTSRWPRRCAAGTRARAAAQAAARRRRRRARATCEDVAALLGVPLRATVKSLVLATDERDDDGADVAETTRLAAAGARRPFAQRGQGRQGSRASTRRLPLRHRRPRSTTHFGCKPGYLGPIGPQQAGASVVADRTVARDERLRLRRQRRGLSLHRRQLGPRPARARSRGRHPQRRRGRSVARRQGRAGDPARHRGRPRVPARHASTARR